MARQYVITEEEMLSLIESLEVVKLKNSGHFRNVSQEEWDRFKMDDMHRSFHMVAVRWAQAMGFNGYRK